MLPPRTYRLQQVFMPMTALIDIVFLLLIYFLLTTNYLVSEVLPLQLPVAETNQTQSSGSIIVSIDKKGDLYFAGQPISETALRDRLTAELQKDLPSLVIRSDTGVELGLVVKLLDMARGCGAKDVSLATKALAENP